MGSHGALSDGGGDLKNSYATGTVSADDDRVGGLVGSISTSAYATVDLEDSYSTGEVSGGSNVGGLVGRSYEGAGAEINVINSYWNTETSGQGSSAGDGKPRTTSEMTWSYDGGTYEDWDMAPIDDHTDETWVSGDHELVEDHDGNTGYPALPFYNVEVTAPEDVTEESADTHTYDFDVKNLGNIDHTFDLTVEDTEADWTVDVQNTVDVAVDESGSVPVDVTIPGDAGGVTNNVTLTATSQGNTDIQDSDTMEITLEPNYDVDVTAPEDTTEEADGEYNYFFDVENIGNIEDTYDLTVEDTEDWTEDVQETVTVQALVEGQVEVDVMIPEGAEGVTSEVTLTAASQNDTGVEDFDSMNVTLEADRDVEVTAPGNVEETSSGTYAYDFDVENLGEVEDTYDLAVEDTEGWTVDVQDTVTVDTGSQKEVEVDVTIPDGAVGVTSEVTLTATSQNDTEVEDSDSMDVTFEAVYDVEVTAPEDVMEESADTYTYDFDLENLGNVDDTYDLSVEDTEDWTVDVQDTVDVDADETEQVPVDVTIPDDAGGVTSEVTLTATSQGGDAEDSGSMKVTLEADYGVVVTALEDEVTEESADTYTYDFDVENLGDVADTYDLTVEDTEGWTLDVQDTVDVGVGEAEQVPVDVTIPDDAGGVTSELTLTAASQDETGVEDSDSMGVTLEADHGVEVTALEDEVTETAEGDHDYEFDVKNLGNADDTYLLGADVDDEEGEGWEVDVQESVDVEFEATETVSVTVTIPGGAESVTNEVTLTATSEGDDDAESSDSMDVTFKQEYELTVEEPKGEGTISVDDDEIPDYPYNETFEEGDEVDLTASPVDGWLFDEWTGDIEGRDEAATSMIMEDDYTISARFLKEYELTVEESEGEGTISVEGEEVPNYPYTDTFVEGEEVELSAESEDGWLFDEWRGDVDAMDDARSPDTLITMDGDHTISVRFLEEYELTVGDPEGEGTISVEGDEVPNYPYTDTFAEGEEVDLLADPDENWYFVRWRGDHDGDDEERGITITMDEDKELSAVFEEETYTLDVVVEGEGTVDTEPDQEEYEPGKEVDLRADPDDGWYFVEWTGDGSGADEEITVVMDGDKEITAHFEEYMTLTIEIEGEGTVEVDPDEDGYERDVEVNLTAVPDDGWYFIEWTGDVPEAEEKEITITMDEDKEVTARFDDESYELTVSVIGGGSVDPSEGIHTYRAGEEVTIEATADEGWHFDEWVGIAETGERIMLTMDEDKTVTARFEAYTPGYFEVEMTDYEESVGKGEEFTVGYEVINSGEVDDVQDIVLEVDSEEMGVNSDLQLGAGDTYEGEFVLELDEAGEYVLEVSSDDTSDEITVMVEDDDGPTEDRGFLSEYWWIIIGVSAVAIGAAAVFMKKGSSTRPPSQRSGSPPPPEYSSEGEISPPSESEIGDGSAWQE